VVTGFQVCGQDNDTGHEFAGYLYAKPQNNTFGAPVLMASVHSGIAAASSGTQCFSTTTITNPSIDNTANAYYVELDVGVLTSAIGVQIIHWASGLSSGFSRWGGEDIAVSSGKLPRGRSTLVVMATISSSPNIDKTLCYQTTTITSATIDNTLNQYWVQVVLPQNTVEFSTVQIDY
jgi:hypothetical protein